MRERIAKIDKILWSVYTFILLFAPPFMPYPHLVLTIFSILLLVTNYKLYWLEAFRKSSIKGLLLSMLVVAMYVFIIPLPISMIVNDLVNTGHYITLFNRFGVLIVTIIPCAGLIISKIIKEDLDYHFFIEIIINAGFIEGLCSIVAFLLPSVKDFFLMLMRKFAESDNYDNMWYITVRSYGFARSLVDVFGLGIAIIAGISFFYGIAEKRKYVIYSFVIFMSTLLNSRTGVVLYIIGIILSIIYLMMTGHFKTLIRTIIAIAVIAIIAIYAWEIVSTNSATSGWIANGLKSFINFFRSRLSTGLSNNSMEKFYIFERNNMELPGVVRTVFGTGHSLYRADGYKQSDVGYINDIWVFGILGCVVLYGTILKIAIYIFKNSTNTLFKFIALFLMICFFIFNMKASAIGYNTGAVALLLVLFGLRYFTYKNQQIRKT